MLLSAEEMYKQLIELDEHPRLEAKTGSEIGPSVMQTVCAFANEPGMGGGCILLGARKVTRTLFERAYDIVDLPNTDQLQADLATQCAGVFNQRIWPQMKPAILFNKRVLTVFVPELPARQKPLHFKDRPLPESAWRRSGSADIRCDDQDIDMFYQERDGESYDESLVDGAAIGDINPSELAFYRELRRNEHPDAEELGFTDAELLVALGCAKPEGDSLRPTVAGILLFGTSFALRRWFPLMRIDYIRVPGKTWMKEPDSRYAAIEIRAPLIRAIQRTKAAILDDVMKDFSLQDGQIQRKELAPIPDKVIREVVVNAVMHRCYKVHGPTQIIRYANRLEIRNPGYSLKLPELFGEPGSQNRNPKIAAVLHELNIAETKGSGIRVMQRKMREANLSPPYLESDRSGNKFVAFLVLQHFMGPETIEWLASFRDLNLTDDEAHALFFVREVRAITSFAYCALTDAEQKDACASLLKLCRAALLKQRGSENHTWYAPTEYLLQPEKFVGKRPKRISRPQSGELAGESGELRQQSGELAGAGEEVYSDFGALPVEVAERLPRLSKRPHRDEIRRAILVLCEWRPLLPAELAQYLDRKSVPRLVEDYISRMTGDELLERTIPDTPTHPAQKYRTTAKGIQHLIVDAP